MDLDTLASRMPRSTRTLDFDREDNYLEIDRPVLLQDLLRPGDYPLDLEEVSSQSRVSMTALMDNGDVCEFHTGSITHNGSVCSYFLFVRVIDCVPEFQEASQIQAGTLGISQSWADATSDALDRLCATGAV